MDTKKPFVITISRELGSGGRTIGRKLAAQLNVRYSDKNLIQDLRERFNLSTYEIEKIKGTKKNWLTEMLDMVAPVPNSGAYIGFEASKAGDWNLNKVKSDDIFQAEAEVLKGIAAEGSCVIAGRSGFFVLKEHPNKLDIFIQAPLEKRVKRVMDKQGLTESEARTIIESVDKSRETYVQRYAGTSRYDTRNYDLVMNVGDMSDEDAVACILKYIKYVSK
ncbi:MAG: cytidylate kinase-like family protein [Bacteroidales bacterium]|nr:cytidylate kinase-like family protein [Bacteroidales bacterium]